MFRKKIPEGFRRLGSKLTALFLIALSFMCSSLVTKAELGGVLYLGGSYFQDKAGTPQLIWDKNIKTMAYGPDVITGQPHSFWQGHWSDFVYVAPDSAKYVFGARVQNQVPVLTLYRIPYADCNQASSSTPLTADQYKTWITNIANGIGSGLKSSDSRNHVDKNTPVIVLLEPDSIGLMPTADFNDPANAIACWKDDGNGNKVPLFDVTERFEMLKQAVKILNSAGGGYACNSYIGRDGLEHRPTSCDSAHSRVKVYLDGGNSGWQSSWIDTMAERLILAGVGEAQGIFTNASNFHKTVNEISFGVDLLDAVDLKASTTQVFSGVYWYYPGPKTQIIDVSRNGNGAIAQKKLSDGTPYQNNGWPYWCDNQYARIGQHPTLYSDKYVNAISTRGPIDHIDGLLWIKPVGETDGCWGGPNTSPNSQPTLDKIYQDGFDLAGNYKVDIRPNERAGWPSPALACGLVTGQYLIPYYNNGRHVVACDGVRYKIPAAPKDFRITHETRIRYGDAADTVTLEWEPVVGACQYVIAARINAGKNDNQTVVKTILYPNGVPTPSDNIVRSTDTWGPPTRYVVNPAVKGRTVVYSIKSVSCPAFDSMESSFVVNKNSFTADW